MKTDVYKGWRDFVFASNTYLLSVLSVQMTVASAYTIISNGDLSSWEDLQSTYESKFKQSIKRIKVLDNEILDNSIMNA